MTTKNPLKIFTAVLFVFLLAAAQYVGKAQGEDPLDPAQNASVKFAHFAPSANTLEGTSVTVQIDGESAISDFQFGDVSEEAISLAPGDHLVGIIPAGGATPSVSETITIAADASYTVIFAGNGSAHPLDLIPLTDDVTPPAAGAKLRLGHLAPFASVSEDLAVDICTDANVLVASLGGIDYLEITDPYLELPAGDYDLKIAEAGSNCESLLLDLPSIRLNEGEIYDLYAIGDVTNQPLQYATTTGLDLTPPAKVKFGHFAALGDPGATSPIAIRVNGEEVLSNLAFGQVSGYLDVDPGEALVEILPAGGATVMISDTVTLNSEAEYTLVTTGNTTLQPLELFLLDDENETQQGVSRLRLVHIAPIAADLADTEVDICLETGEPVPGLEGIAYKELTAPEAYLSLEPGPYDLKVTDAGSGCATTLLDLPLVTLFDGDVRSLFIYGDEVNSDLSFLWMIFQFGGDRIWMPLITHGSPADAGQTAE